MGVATALTVQTPRGVRDVRPVDPDVFAAQLDAVLEDVPPAAVKLGMLATGAIAEIVADRLGALPDVPVVVDPVLASTSGAALLDEAGLKVLAERLLSRATVLTPNLAEAAALGGRPVVDLATMKAAAGSLALRGAPAVLVKGGHLDGDPVDVLFVARARGVGEGRFRVWRSNRVRRAPRGTGCALASAIAGHLAQGGTIEEAVAAARKLVGRAIREAYVLGDGDDAPALLRIPAAPAGPRYRRSRR